MIPNKRQLAVQDPTAMSVTPDGRFLLYSNLTPATSVTAVDLHGNKVAGEIQTPGCSEILILGAREFASVCADGSMLTTQFDDDGKTTEQKRTAKPFFDVEKDPVFASAGDDRQAGLLRQLPRDCLSDRHVVESVEPRRIVAAAD